MRKIYKIKDDAVAEQVQLATGSGDGTIKKFVYQLCEIFTALQQPVQQFFSVIFVIPCLLTVAGCLLEKSKLTKGRK